VRNLSSEFERCVVFRFRVNGGHGTDGQTGRIITVFQWSLAGIQKEQQADRDIRYISELLQQNTVKPPWESVALASHDVKTLWTQWPRLQIKDGLLKRRFESPDGLSVHWQVVWPSSLRAKFLRLAHGGMTGGHFGRRLQLCRSLFIGARRPRSLTSFTDHSAFIGAWRPRSRFLERDWLARAAKTL